MKLSDETHLSSESPPPTLGSASVTLPKGFIIFNIIILRPLCFDEFFHKIIMTIYANLCHGVLLRIMFRLFLFWFSLFLRSSCFARSCDCVTDWLRTLDSFMEYSTSNYGVQTLIRQRTSFPHEQNQCSVSNAFFPKP